MLVLTEAQDEALYAAEVSEFIEAMTDRYIAERPGEHPARDIVRARMQAAFDWTREIGFTRSGHIKRFMRLMCDAPPMLHDAQLDAYLRKPGATPEQRLDDMLAVLRKQLEEREDN